MKKKLIRFKDLVKFLDEKTNFRREGKKGKLVWRCDCQLTFTKEFCKINNLWYQYVKDLLYATGGYCDCEVLFNSIDKIKSNTILPSKNKRRLIRKKNEERNRKS